MASLLSLQINPAKLEVFFFRSLAPFSRGWQQWRF